MRGSGRVPLLSDVALTVEGYPKPIVATLVDLSISGCRLTARSVFLIGADVEFRLELSSSGVVLARGKIRRCTPTDLLGTLEYGVEFSGFSSDDGAALAAFIDGERQRETIARSGARVETEFPVQCVIAGQKNALAAIAIDIGHGGMRIACDNALPEGATMTIRFPIPGDTGRELVMRARIVQRKQQFREYHHNIAFMDEDPGIAERIERFIRSHR